MLFNKLIVLVNLLWDKVVIKQKDFQKDLQMHLLMPVSDQQLFAAMLTRKTHCKHMSFTLDNSAQ